MLILLVEDDPLIAQGIIMGLHLQDIQVEHASNAREALYFLQ
ncbi:hypothetical protein ACF3NA_04975 [Alkanindiges sp. WGS2144]